MIKLLAKIFIKDSEDASSERVRRTYGVLCGAAGIFFNILLFAGKFIAGTMSGSIAITSDAFNNLSDAGSSGVTLLGFRLAGQKPDLQHPFGHGRFEYISGLIVSMVIVVMGFELLVSSVKKLITPETPEFSLLAIGILAASILIKLYMAFYNRRYSKMIHSPALFAAMIDSLSDCVATAVVLIATLITKFAGVNLDAIGGLLVSGFILYSGVRAGKETISPLLGEPPTRELVKHIIDLVLSHEQVTGVHDLIVHDYGPGRCMVSLHAEVPENGDMVTLHDVVDNIEHDLRNELGCLAVIHMDPISCDNENVNRLKEQIEEKLKTLGDGITTHDFRIVRGPTHTNVIFDAVIPFELNISMKEAREKITALVKSVDQNLNAVVDIDRPYAYEDEADKK
ncbi:MAG TPA: cation diffusion facilitator family transporter [Oscillospiraceae bacterium]|nr:cation diffusion facilitator family transporter [Oscillospiraceae bacterium]HPF55237.1 cation diffusion facilitator family transporter [Clostridiales bacterium]HPK35273.1 cation diffusion facilitator family transporter [Oscillospiraceae bacterium]HPR75466.1 cation diffusion facilitator family transporter [Oscillospiraceae bacterium]